MADRSFRLPRLPTIPGFGASPRGAAAETGQPGWAHWDRVRAVARHPERVRLFLWQLLWLPYWLWSDVPAPHLPSRNMAVPADSGLAGHQVVRMLDAIRRRVWLNWALSLLVRGAWLGAFVGCVWLVVERLGGPAFRVEPLFWVGGATLAVGALLAAVNRPTRFQTARMLDRSFRLHDRISTALGNLGKAVPPTGVRAEVTYLQVADAANVIAELRRHPAFRARPPLRELVLGLTCLLALACLFFLRGVGGDVPVLGVANVPAFSPAASRVTPPETTESPGAAPGEPGEGPSTDEVQARAQRSNEAQRDLNALGAALDNTSVTNAAAEAIADGDYAEAGEELREVGQSVDELSMESRSALADDLDQAADQMSPGGSDLAEAARQAADGLREGGTPAQQGLNDLGEQVQETGADVASQQELREQLSQAQAQDAASAAEPGAEGAEASDAGEPGEAGPSGDASGDTADGSQAGEGGQQGDSQAGQEGSAATESGEGGGGQQPGEGEGQNGQGGQSGGEGADAAPNRGGQQASADRGSNPAGARQSGAGEQRGRDRQSSSAASGGATQPGAQGDPSAGSDTQASAPSDASGSAETGQQGTGAGGGQGEPNEAEQPGGGSGGGQDSSASEEPPEDETDVTTAEQPSDAAVDLPEPVFGDSAIGLEDSGGAGVQTSNNAGSASAGSGTGVMTASGNAQQQEVDDAGPDSNRVPADARENVEDYFSETGDGG